MAANAPSATKAARHKARSRALAHFAAFLPPFIAAIALLGHGMATWALPLYAFLAVPILELLIPPHPDALSAAEERASLEDPLFNVLVYLVLPLQWAILIVFLFQVGETGPTWWERAGRVASMGVLCGTYGINVAHELGHRAKRVERVMARALLLSSLYMHFIIEHNRGHHMRVATPEDPSSARSGETVYAFWVRSVVFGFISAWRIEAGQQRKKGRPVLNVRNEMLQALVIQTALLAVIGLVFGGLVLGCFLAAAAMGILLLETVNYIEHYGLRRKPGANGGYRRVQYVHSWNSDHLLGRLTLFELTRHSDHHWKASRPYQVLRSIGTAPQLPTGYPGTMLLSLLPPLFFRVMHPRLKAMVEREEELELAA